MYLSALYEDTIHYLALALNQIGFKMDASSSPKIYNEWPISRGEWYNLAIISKNYLRHSGVKKTIHWLRAVKKQRLTTGLLSMHHALIAWQQGDEKTAVTHLQQSQQSLNQLLMRETAVSTAPFSQYWLDLRQEWAQFWRMYIRLNDPKYIQRFELITTWQYQ